MKLNNRIKNELFTYNSSRFKLLFLFLFLITSFTSYAENKRITILKQAAEILAQAEQTKEEYKEIRAKIDSLQMTKQIDELQYVKIANQLGGIFQKEGKLIDAIELYLQLVSYYEQKKELSSKENESLVQFCIPLGAAHEEFGLWNKAMEYYIKALGLSEKYNLEKYKSMIYNNIGTAYYAKDELKKAETYIQKALAINLKNDNKKELFNNYNNLGGIYLRLNKDSQALDYALQAIQLLDNKKDPYLYYFMQTNIGSLHLQKGEYSLAMSYLRNAMVHQKQLGLHSYLMETYTVLSDVFYRTGYRDSSYIYLQKALNESIAQANKKKESGLQRKLAQYYEDNKRYQDAYNALKQSMILRDSILTTDNKRQINNMELIYNAETKMREQELFIKDITLQKITTNRLWIIMFAFIFGLIITIFFLLYYSRNKEKQRKAQSMLAAQQTIIFENLKKTQIQKEEALSRTLDQRNRELTSYTLHMIKNNEFLADINEELKQLLLELNPKDRLHKQQIQQLQIKLQQQNSTNNWDDFRYYFEQVHPSFYKQLEQSYPDLTFKEQRLCAFLRLGLSSKDIAAITFKEVRSVESARNRLRKKLNLNPDGNLTDFLSKDFVL